MAMLLDGGMGQELVKRARGKPTPLWGTQVMMDQPDLVRTIHDDYFAAGASIATTNTYALHRDRLAPRGLGDRHRELIELACKIALESRDAHGSGLVAGSIGPLDFTYVSDDGPPRDEAAALFFEIAEILAPQVDVLLAESVPSVARAVSTLDGLEGHGRPVWLAFTVSDEDGTRLRSGEPVSHIRDVISDRSVDAVLINCSFPEAVSSALTALRGIETTLGGYANGFTGISDSYMLPGATIEALQARRDLTPEVYADFVSDWLGLGAAIVGGCCEVGPDHIAEMNRRFFQTDNG